MNKTMRTISKLLITVVVLSVIIFTGCSCGDKKTEKETAKNHNKGVAATVINADGSVEYVDDIIKKDQNNANNEEDINSIVNSKDGKKASSSKTNTKKATAKKTDKKNSKNSKTGENKSNNKSNKDSKKSDSKKSDSKKDDMKDDGEKTTKKRNFEIKKGDDDNRFGPIIRGKKKK